MKTIDSLRRDLKKSYKRLGSWSRVGMEFRIGKAMAFRIAERNYEPKDIHIRMSLGLPAYVIKQVQICERCGKIHPQLKRCTARPAMWMRKVWDTPVEELRWRLDHREEFVDEV
jgi:hypothetical protein